MCPDCPLPVEHTPDSESVSLGGKFEALSMSSAGGDALVVEEEKLVCEEGDAGDSLGGKFEALSMSSGDALVEEEKLVCEGGDAGGAEGELVGGDKPRRSTRIRVPSRKLQKTPPATPSKPNPPKKLRNGKASKK